MIFHVHNNFSDCRRLDIAAYKDCAQFIISQLKTISCLEDIGILPESPEDSPVVIAKWRGVHEDWPVLVLNSHYDVVPAALDDWTVDPFKAIRKDGKVFGRGAQDMKCVCVQYIEAIRKLHSIHPEFQPQRTVHLTFGTCCFLASAYQDWYFSITNPISIL